MIALSFNQSIYYYLYKDVQPGEELLVWYGKDYARYLAISSLPDANYDWSSDFAPPKSVVVCPSCHWSKGYANLNLK
uniref:SET domain-containing protein n=1 Tax=Romanomermis culicivorax TaxID=13658 RepID=A0A915KYT0_ROMCU